MSLPHIIFLMTDQHRGDCVGCNGNSVIKTPHLDELAKEGVTFRRAYASVPSCTPSRAAILTGMSPWNHGMLGYGKGAIHYRYEMPQMLRDTGYYTFGIGKMHWHPQRNLHGFHGELLDESSRVENRGFESDYTAWFHEHAPGKKVDATGIGWNDNHFGDYVLEEFLHPTAWTGQMAVEKIRAHDPNQPLFLKVSFARPHSPYDAPARFAQLYNWQDMPAPFVGDWCDRARKAKKLPSPAFGDFGTDWAKKARRHYYANIMFIDEKIGEIIATLKEKGMFENALILFTSDHGDMLGDHYHWRKTYAFEGSARIPMIVRWPDAMKTEIPRGAVLDHLVELRDILPTFLDAAGALIPKDVDGKSILGLLRNRNEPWRTILDLEHSTAYSPRNYWMALTDHEIKYIYFRSTGEELLFNIKTDPMEERNLAKDASSKTILYRWRELMVQHLAIRGKKWVKKGKLVKQKIPQLYSPNYPKND